VPVEALGEFMKSPFCSGRMWFATMKLASQSGGLNATARLPDVVVWLQEKGVDVGRAPKGPLPATP
jgi:hypothetical protein